MEITQRHVTRDGRRYRIRLSYNERIKDADKGDAFVRAIDVVDIDTQQTVPVDAISSAFSTYEKFQSFGGYCAVNYMGVRETAIEGLRTKVLTRVEDALERLA